MPKYTVSLSGMIHASYTRTVRAADMDAAIDKVIEHAQKLDPRRFDLDWKGDELDEVKAERC